MKIKVCLIQTCMLCGTAMLLLPLWDQSVFHHNYWVAVQIIGSFLCVSSVGMACMTLHRLQSPNDQFNRGNIIGQQE